MTNGMFLTVCTRKYAKSQSALTPSMTPRYPYPGRGSGGQSHITILGTDPFRRGSGASMIKPCRFDRYFAPAEDRALRGRNLSADWSLQTAEGPGGLRAKFARLPAFCWSSRKA